MSLLTSVEIKLIPKNGYAGAGFASGGQSVRPQDRHRRAKPGHFLTTAELAIFISKNIKSTYYEQDDLHAR